MKNNIDVIIKQNKKEIAEIARQNAIKFIGLFGSYSRNQQNLNSDLDLLVRFDFDKKEIGLFKLYEIQEQFENLFGKKVDIVTNPNKLFAPLIEHDLITIYEDR